MEFSLLAIAGAIGLNTSCCISMYDIQQKEAKAGMIQGRRTKVPGTNQQFLHWQDFYCQRYGDTVGLAIIAVGFCHLILYDFISPDQWIIFIGIATIDAIGFTLICLGKNHKPDSGYPEIGEVSWCGLYHSVYYGINVTMVALCIWHWLVEGNLNGPVLCLTLVGGIFYLLTFAADIITGHFNPIKRI